MQSVNADVRRKEVDVYGAARARRQSGRRAARKGWKRVRERTCRTRSRVSGVCADEEGGVGRTALLRLRVGGGAEAMRWWVEGGSILAFGGNVN